MISFQSSFQTKLLCIHVTRDVRVYFITFNLVDLSATHASLKFEQPLFLNSLACMRMIYIYMLKPHIKRTIFKY